MRDFCEFCGYTESEFWAILDKFYNTDIFHKDEYGRWMLNHPIWQKKDTRFCDTAPRFLAKSGAFFAFVVKPRKKMLDKP